MQRSAHKSYIGIEKQLNLKRKKTTNYLTNYLHLQVHSFLLLLVFFADASWRVRGWLDNDLTNFDMSRQEYRKRNSNIDRST